MTHYRVLAYHEDTSLLDIALETGRTHQIRVHLAHLGHPLVGDGIYGRRGGGHRLIAYRLGFVHPAREEPMVFDSDLPDWAQG